MKAPLKVLICIAVIIFAASALTLPSITNAADDDLPLSEAIDSIRALEDEVDSIAARRFRLPQSFDTAAILRDLETRARALANMAATAAARSAGYTIGPNGRFSGDIKDNYIQGFKDMTKELSRAGNHAVGYIGMYFDADMQLDTQLTYQQLNAQAHKDYHPSEEMCRFGTFVRSVARTEEKMKSDRIAVNAHLMSMYSGKPGTSTAKGADTDNSSRMKQFIERYCDPDDNSSGLYDICGDTTDHGERTNKDIDYTRTIASKLTLDLDFEEPALGPDEEDIYALGRNLYWLNDPIPQKKKKLHERDPLPYQNIRRLIAMNNVAHNSYATIVAERSGAKEGNAEQSGWNFMKALFVDFGIPEDQIHELLGDYPSYYAQMDVLTKKMYQNPEFYTNLYDKPVNVRRVGTSMDAIKLMQNRDLYNASLRKEMLLSMMIERQVGKKLEELRPGDS